jgi:hypothetical protein
VAGGRPGGRGPHRSRRYHLGDQALDAGDREPQGESAHIESESHEYDLHAFQAIRDMDEILVANFGV